MADPLSREFQVKVFTDQIRALKDIDQVKEVAVQMMKLNFQRRDWVADQIKRGLLPTDESSDYDDPYFG